MYGKSERLLLLDLHCFNKCKFPNLQFEERVAIW
jgi:hypothetical protein